MLYRWDQSSTTHQKAYTTGYGTSVYCGPQAYWLSLPEERIYFNSITGTYYVTGLSSPGQWNSATSISHGNIEYPNYRIVSTDLTNLLVAATMTDRRGLGTIDFIQDGAGNYIASISGNGDQMRFLSSVSVKGNFITQIYSSNPSAYPLDGQQGGYWYI